MGAFKLSKDARDWFAPAFRESHPMSTQFDQYYLCLLIGLKYKERAKFDVGSAFIDYWISDYNGIKELLLGLLLTSKLESMGIEVDERDAVQELCSGLFTQKDTTLLTQEGLSALDQIAHGGFKVLAESFPDDDRPRSQFQLLTHVADLLIKE